MRKLVGYAVLFLTMASSGVAKEKNPPSSVLINAPEEKVKSVLAAHLVGNGWRLDSDNQFQQTWAKSMDGMRAALISIIGTPSACYAIHPRHLLTFNFISGENGGTLVLETDQLETATAMCQKAIQEIDGKKERAATATELGELKTLCEKFVASNATAPGSAPVPVAQSTSAVVPSAPLPAPLPQPLLAVSPRPVSAPIVQGTTASESRSESLGDVARRLRIQKDADAKAAQEKQPNP